MVREKEPSELPLWQEMVTKISSRLVFFCCPGDPIKRNHNGILLPLKRTRNNFWLGLQTINLWLWDEASFLKKKKKSYWQISWIIPAAPEAGPDSFFWAHVVLISSRRKATLVPVWKRFLVCNKLDNLKNTKTFSILFNPGPVIFICEF